jgi:alpha-glucosidase (family GH31 glycosyl hydrolase)
MFKSKKMNKTAIIFTLLVICASCIKNPFAKFSLSPEKGHPKISLENEDEILPVCFTGSEADSLGSIYFFTDKGITWLNGDPDSLVNEPLMFEAYWKIDNRQISVKIEKSIDEMKFLFEANPSNDINGWGFGIAASENEYFTGLFERTVDGDQTESWKEGISEGMNLRGQKVEMIVKPTLSLYCPFYISSNGYGLFIDGTWPGKYDFCKSDPKRVIIEFEGNKLSGKIYLSKNPAEIVKKHYKNIGGTIVPPKWAFLPWRWRDNHENKKKYYDGTQVNSPYNSQLVEDILMMKALDIPCGAYWVDRPWAKDPHGYADFNWDPKRFPKATEMIKWLHKNDTRFMLWIAPWVAGKMREEAIKKGYSQKMTSYLKLDSSNVAVLDYTNPETCKWWQDNLAKLLNQGVDGFKMDRGEENVPDTKEVVLWDKRTAREVRNHYPVMYVKTANEICKKIKGDDFVIFPRAGYTGSAKYAAFWGGDIGVPAEGLRTAIIAVQRCAIIGFPIWGSDIGGYWQGTLDREVCARWLAFGCFTPIMEFGPTDDRAPWDMPTEPKYDAELIAIWRLYAKIHAGLADYSHQLAKEANETGMPPVRPLFLVYPDQKEAWTEWQNFMYGPDILVHAIWKKGETKVKVYLPKGERWRDAWNKEKVYDGGQFIEIETPLQKIPIFTRESSKIDLGNLNDLFNKSIEIAKKKPNLNELERKYLK